MSQGTVTTTKSVLRGVMTQWEEDRRAGRTIGNEERDALTTAEVGRANADDLWHRLGGKPDVGSTAESRVADADAIAQTGRRATTLSPPTEGGPQASQDR